MQRKARQLVAPGKFTAFLTYFYAFLVMAVMYGAQQYTKAFGLAYCGLSEMQAKIYDNNVSGWFYRCRSILGCNDE